jgi:hypothetical protein
MKASEAESRFANALALSRRPHQVKHIQDCRENDFHIF